jgi:hypothetical protein
MLDETGRRSSRGEVGNLGGRAQASRRRGQDPGFAGQTDLKSPPLCRVRDSRDRHGLRIRTEASCRAEFGLAGSALAVVRARAKATGMNQRLLLNQEWRKKPGVHRRKHEMDSKTPHGTDKKMVAGFRTAEVNQTRAGPLRNKILDPFICPIAGRLARRKKAPPARRRPPSRVLERRHPELSREIPLC